MSRLLSAALAAALLGGCATTASSGSSEHAAASAQTPSSSTYAPIAAAPVLISGATVLVGDGQRPVGRQGRLNEVWGDNAAVTTHTLETHIYRLRQKIEPDPTNASLLLTEGGGYRLNPEGGTSSRVV